MVAKVAPKPAATPTATAATAATERSQEAQLAEQAATAATERSQEAQLAELLNQEAGMGGEYELKVHNAKLIPYSYPWQGKQISTKKVQLLLQSHIPEQYCLGIAKLKNRDEVELKQILDMFPVGSTWKFKEVQLLDEKTAFLPTACRIAIDLRKTKKTAMLQSASFPRAPTPVTTIADILTLKRQQRFDLMAIPAEILAERRSGAGQNIADVRLVDGSQDPRSNATEHVNAKLPLTLFFKSDAEFASFKGYVGRTPLLFMCLAGSVQEQAVKVTTIKDMTWWEPASGTKSDSMAGQAGTLCNASTPSADVAQLPDFQPQEATNYADGPATLSVCSLLDLKANSATLLGDATEHLYQLNHMYVPQPTKADSILYSDRLFAVFECYDLSKKVSLAFRSKAMLQLADLTLEEEYKNMHANGELRHPLLASLRVRIKRKDGAAATEHGEPTNVHSHTLEALVVEAKPCAYTEDIPDDSIDAMHGMLAAGPQMTNDRLLAAPLQNLTASPFYNMIANGEPSDKALVLLKFSQRSNGKQIGNGYRIVAHNVRDACDSAATQLYSTIACCTVEKSPDFTCAKDSLALAVICKVASPSQPRHAADLYIEAMEPVTEAKAANVMATVIKLQRFATVADGNAAVSQEAAWQQRKCRRLERYPTIQ